MPLGFDRLDLLVEALDLALECRGLRFELGDLGFESGSLVAFGLLEHALALADFGTDLLRDSFLFGTPAFLLGHEVTSLFVHFTEACDVHIDVLGLGRVDEAFRRVTEFFEIDHGVNQVPRSR